MHKLNVRILGPSSFVSTLNELKMFLKFNPLIDNFNDNTNIILFHVDILKDKKHKDFINSFDTTKICAGNRKDLTDMYDANIELPTTLKEINAIVDKTVAKKNSIKIPQ